MLYSFIGGTDGSESSSNVVFSTTGTIFGTTSTGGAIFCQCGTIFRLTPGANGVWEVNIVHRFHGVDGAYAYNGMVGDGLGNFYGAPAFGGKQGDGVIYKFTP